MRTILRCALLLIVAASMAHAQSLPWRQLESPFGGSIYFFISSPQGAIFTTEEQIGMFYSTNEGATWRTFGTGTGGGFPVLAYQNTLFAVTDDRGGIFRTTDAGATWEKTSKGADSIRPGLMTRTSKGTLIVTGRRGSYRSMDNGDNWIPCGLDSFECRFPTTAPDGTVFMASEGEGLFRSTDDGATWAKTGGMPISADAIVFRGGGDIIVGADNGMFRSQDNGQTLQPFALAGRHIGPLGVGLLPGGDLVAVVADSGVYRISSDGANVTLLSAPTGGSSGLHTTASGAIVVGYRGKGIIRSSDNGATFNAVGLPFAQNIKSLTEGPGGAIYAGCDGLFESTDAGTTWQDLKMPAGRALAVALFSSDSILVAGEQGDAFRTLDGGKNWEKMTVNVGPDFSDAMVVGPRSAIMSSNDGIIRTTDAGATWSATIQNENIYDLAKSPNGDIWAVGFSNVYQSTDAGASWQGVAQPGSLPSLSDGVIASPATGTVIVAVAGSALRVLRTTNSGSTWDTSLVACAGSGLHISSDPGGKLFLSTGCGIYQSPDAGVTWSLFSQLPQNEFFGPFLIDSHGDAWYGGRRGIYTTSKVMSAPDEKTTVNERSTSLRTYPNPVRNSMSVTFRTDKQGYGTLSILNLLGQQIATVAEGTFEAGNHTVQIELNTVIVNGTYLLQLSVGGVVETRQIQIIR